MDDYKLDFGKLAYSKTEDLTKRITSIEGKKQDNYNSLYFKTDNIIINSTHTKTETFTAQKSTNLNFMYNLSGSGEFEIEVYINEVFVFSENISLTESYCIQFEAKGVESGAKQFKTQISGNGTIDSMSISLSGQNIEYLDTNGNISNLSNSCEDYILRSFNDEVILYNYDGTSLNIIKSELQQSNCCKILPHLESDYLLLFYTAWDNTLYYEIFSKSLNKTTVKAVLKSGVKAFTVCAFTEEVWLYYIKDNRCYFSSGCFINDKLCFSEDVLLNISNVLELEAVNKDKRIYLIYADEHENAKLLYTPENINAQKEFFSYSVSLTLEDI